jgi:hypothetical protein
MLYHMRRVRSLIVAIVLLLSAAAGVLAFTVQRSLTEPTYTVAQVRALLASQRRAEGDRVIRIHGMVTTMQETFPCVKPSCALVGIADSIDDPASALLWLGQDADNPFWGAVRAVPLIGKIAPPRQEPLVGDPGTYQIRLLARPDCSGMRCYDAVLLDSQPPTPPHAGQPLRATGGTTAGGARGFTGAVSAGTQSSGT